MGYPFEACTIWRAAPVELGGTDQDWLSVQGLRLDQLFRDGFESGDAGRWSAALP